MCVCAWERTESWVLGQVFQEPYGDSPLHLSKFAKTDNICQRNRWNFTLGKAAQPWPCLQHWHHICLVSKNEENEQLMQTFQTAEMFPEVEQKQEDNYADMKNIQGDSFFKETRRTW